MKRTPKNSAPAVSLWFVLFLLALLVQAGCRPATGAGPIGRRPRRMPPAGGGCPAR